MNVVVSIDSFKGSLSSLEAGNAIKKGILSVNNDTNVTVLPLADGGEGTLEALSLGMGGHIESVSVTGPLGERIIANYGILDKTGTAIIEMSTAAGITLVPPEVRNPLITTTYGVGELILDAIKKGCRKFIVGIGGSATNDGGVGMLQALGFSFADINGEEIPLGARGLSSIASISDENVCDVLKDCSFRIACDVTNPLCGELGCSAIFGPQKGATMDMIKTMDNALMHYAKLSMEKNPNINMNASGTGAAGGLGFAFLAYTNATLEPGVDIILEETNLENHILNADLVITGEGRLDSQTVMGKAPIGVAKLAKKHNKKVIAFSGCIGNGAEICNDYGIDAYFSILREIVTLQEAMDSDYAAHNLCKTAAQVFRLISPIR